MRIKARLKNSAGLVICIQEARAILDAHDLVLFVFRELIDLRDVLIC
jgi:hypothetical protein